MGLGGVWRYGGVCTSENRDQRKHNWAPSWTERASPVPSGTLPSALVDMSKTEISRASSIRLRRKGSLQICLPAEAWPPGIVPACLKTCLLLPACCLPGAAACAAAGSCMLLHAAGSPLAVQFKLCSCYVSYNQH